MAILALLAVLFCSAFAEHQEVVFGERGTWTYGVTHDQDGNAVYHLLETSDKGYPGEESHCEHFSYNNSRVDGPAKWGSLCPAWKACGTGSRQSPINIITKSAVHQKGNLFSENYAIKATGHIVNNGHTVMSTPVVVGSAKNNLRGGPLLNDFELVQYHYHTPSEHTIDGKRFPLELHLVHKNTKDASQIAVIGLFFEPSYTSSATLASLVTAIKSKDMIVSNATDLPVLLHDELFPTKKEPTYYNYLGSLTTPPCSEVVTWYVMENPLPATQIQISTLSSLMGSGNARPVVVNKNKVIHYMATTTPTKPVYLSAKAQDKIDTLKAQV